MILLREGTWPKIGGAYDNLCYFIAKFSIFFFIAISFDKFITHNLYIDT